MKKIKVLLTAAVVVASVGGALAFTSANKSGAFVCRGAGQTSGACPDPVQDADRYRTATNGTLTRFCNDGQEGTNCNVQRTNLVQDAK